jgi:hypothetical protein
MSDDGKAILDTLDQVRSYFQELARMLGALDPLMGSVGWSPVGGTTVINQTSQSLTQPRKWMPQYVFRVYTAKARPELIAVPKVLMSRDFQSAHHEPSIEPLLSGVLLDFGAGKDASKTWQYEHAAWHPKLDGRADDGRVTTFSRTADKACPAVRVATWSVPMMSIRNSEALKAHIVDVITLWLAENPPKKSAPESEMAPLG